MASSQAKIVYYFILSIGYLWSVVQLIVGEPFDALVLLVVTEYFRQYRNAVRRIGESNES